MLASARAVWSKRLRSAKGPFVLGGLALALCLPSLRNGLQTDDHLHAAAFAQGIGAFQFLEVPAEDIARNRMDGFFSWWSSPKLAIDFFRPLASVTHWVEHQLWPEAAWAMHLLSSVLYALLVVVAALGYREITPALPIASLAALMFAIDEAHGLSVGWIASRNTVMAVLFALLALLLHVRSYKHGHQRGQLARRLAAAGCTALALLSAEIGTAALAYVGAYVLVMESGPLRARVASLLPQALVGGAWVAVYVAGGYGIRHAGWYRSVSDAPLDVLAQGIADLPLWIVSQLGLNLAEVAAFQPQQLGRLLGLVLLLPLGAWLLPVLRSSKEARFFALGMLLSIIPLFTTVPQGRLLLAAGFGGFGWISCALHASAGSTSRFTRAGTRTLRALHLYLAPLTFVLMLDSVAGMEAAAQALRAAIPAGSTQAFLINSPVELLAQQFERRRPAAGQSPLSALHQLYVGGSKLRVERIDERTLEISASEGWGTRPIERLFTPAEEMPQVGETRRVTGMQATVMAVSDAGLPTRVRFELPTKLESPERTWLVWEGKRALSWRPPAIGQHTELPALSPLTSLQP